jgi:hypothetical protein
MTKKGIAVLQSSDGNPVHKLLEDGTAHLGNDQVTCTITLQGSKIELADLDVQSATGTLTGSVAHAMNAISSSMRQEIIDSANRINTITGSFDDLSDAAFGENSDRSNTVYAAGSTGVITAATSMLNADQLLDEEVVRQRLALDDMEDTDISASGKATSVRKKIADVVGDAVNTQLSADGVQSLQEMATSLTNDRNFARTVLLNVANKIDVLDGQSDGAHLRQLDKTLNDVSGTIEANRLLNEYTDVSAHPDTAGAHGSQYTHNADIRKMNEVMGINADGTHASVTVLAEDGALDSATDGPVARDVKLAAAANTLDSEIDGLLDKLNGSSEQIAHFKADNGETITLTMTAGSATLSGSLTNTGTFTFPVVSDPTNGSLVRTDGNGAYQGGTEVAGSTSSQFAHSGKCFYLAMGDDTARTRFPQGNKFYFNENGVWFPSEMLVEDDTP